MKGFVHIRIDDRLIHGQVATRWSTGLKVNRIMVIDDAVAANDNEKAILRMAAPAGVNTSILPLEKAVANIQNGNYDGQRVMLIVKSPVTLVKMLEMGVQLLPVNIGNMSNHNLRRNGKQSGSHCRTCRRISNSHLSGAKQRISSFFALFYKFHSNPDCLHGFFL